MEKSQNRVFFNKVIDKSVMKHFIGRLICWRGEIYTAHILDQLKTLGFKHSTKTGFSLGVDDLSASPLKTWIIQDAENETHISQEYFRYGGIHAIERLRQIVETWHTTSEFLKREMSFSFNILDSLNPVHMMSFSGARGNTSQVHQLVGMRGLISDPQGNIVDLPIQNNLREGLSLTEYIISCYGARKGVVDTAIRTADAGYLTRRLVQIAQHVVVRHIDCNTPWGVYLRSIRNSQGNFYLSSENRLVGRVLARPIYVDKRCIAVRNQDIGTQLAIQLTSVYKKEILVRSPLVCKSPDWVCQMCYGWGYSHGKMVTLGEAVGIIAGQSIGEPGTQLTLRTFHTGGVFTGDISNHIRAPFNGIIRFESTMCKPTRNRHGRISWKCVDNVSLVVNGQDKTSSLFIPANSLLLVNNNQYVESKQILAEVRTTVAPLKEKVQRHIYSNLEGEVVYKCPVLCFANNWTNSVYSNLINTPHVLVCSARTIDFIGKQTFTIYKSKDYIQACFTVGKKLIDSRIKTFPFAFKDNQSFLIGTNINFDSLINQTTGIIRHTYIRNPIILEFLILSVSDQFQLTTIKKKTPITNQNWVQTSNIVNDNSIIKPNSESKNYPIFASSTTCILGFVRRSIEKKKGNAYIGFIGKNKVIFQSVFNATTNRINRVIKQITNNTMFYAKTNIVLWSWIKENKSRGNMEFLNLFSNIYLLKKIFCSIIFIESNFLKIGQIIWKNNKNKWSKQLSESGKIICISKKNITFRLTQTYLLPSGAIIHTDCYNTIKKGDILITLMYEQLRTSDIIQGLPKAEQLLEARSINEVVIKLENNFFALSEQIIRETPNLVEAYNLSANKSKNHSQIELVNRIQAVYLAQGVHILDKHIELIVRQMSSKVILTENKDRFSIAYDNHAFLPGEIVEITRIQKIDCVLENFMTYKPLLLGITRASLNTKSVISEASFQRTAKVLSRSALQGRVDWIKGLQENVVFGSIIPAGTGCSQINTKSIFIHKSSQQNIHRLKYTIFVNQLFPTFSNDTYFSFKNKFAFSFHNKLKTVVKESNNDLLSNTFFHKNVETLFTKTKAHLVPFSSQDFK